MIRSEYLYDGIRYGAVLLAVWLGWEVVKAPLVERGAPELATRLAPTSPDVLRRAAEVEFAAERNENAAALASESLARAPFNVRSLRVLGLVKANAGQLDQADQLITLAGNWSLRDDPAHAWLVDRRLRQGSYGSAFAHADTLARRREETSLQVFDLFVTAALQDRRAMPALAAAVGRNPPWRNAFMAYLIRRPDTDPVILALAINLANTEHPLSRIEMQWLYQTWYGEGRIPAIRYLAETLKRPTNLEGLQNGDFSYPEDDQILPFGWALVTASGLAPAIMEDDVRPDETALRVEYDGYAVGELVDQLLVLEPGAYTLSGQDRIEVVPGQDSGLRWSVICVETGNELATYRSAAQTAGWKPFSVSFTVPTDQCLAQRLRLLGVAGDRRDTTIIWFDKFAIHPAEAL